MFGTIYSPIRFPAIDGDCAFAMSVGAARQCMAEYRRRTVSHLNGPWPTSGDWYVQIGTLPQSARRDAYQIMHVWRWSIEGRTRVERIQAERLVADDNVWFVEPACAGDTCDQCSRPLWHHIALSDGDVLCPVGRRYWSLARAIVKETSGRDLAWHRTVLAEIARP